jgi:type 1 glutamine amidotransferase
MEKMMNAYVQSLLAFTAVMLSVVSVRAEPVSLPVVRRLYIDQSHDFSFTLDHLGKTLRADGNFDVTISLATFPPPDLRDFDAIVLLQWHKATPFDSDAVAAIKKFVSSGGGLYLVGNRANFEKAGRKCPIENVLSCFGYDLTVSGQAPITTVAGDFSKTAHVLTLPKGNLMCVLKAASANAPLLRNVQVVAQEAGGGTVALAGEYGKGRVFLSSDTAFAADAPAGPQRDLLIGVMRWVSRAADSSIPSRMEHKRAGIRRRDPELVLKSEGLEVLYPAYLKHEAELLTRDYPPIRKAIQEFFQWDRFEPIKVIAITGGGFTDPKYIGIGVCDVSDEDRRGFLLFEGANCMPKPEVTGLGESWAVFMNRTLGPKLGTMNKAEVNDPWAAVRQLVLPDDPELDKFDISKDMRADPLPGKPQHQGTWVQYRKKKCALLLNMLYEQYGVEFIRRLFRIHFA